MPETQPAERFREDDGQGRELVVYDREDGKAALQIEGRRHGVRTADASWVADPAIAPDLHRAICEASGTLPPVMLGRPDLGPTPRTFLFRGLDVSRSADGGVTFAIGGNRETLPPSQVRQMAATAVALADEPEFAPGDVDGLAGALHAVECGCREGPTESNRDTARAALRWMRDRGARDA